MPGRCCRQTATACDTPPTASAPSAARSPIRYAPTPAHCPDARRATVATVSTAPRARCRTSAASATSPPDRRPATDRLPASEQWPLAATGLGITRRCISHLCSARRQCEQAMPVGTRERLPDRAAGHPQPLRDLRVAQFLQMGQHEGFLHVGRQSVQRLIHRLHPVQRQSLHLRRRRHFFRQRGQQFQATGFPQLAALPVRHQPARDGGQERPGLTDLIGRPALITLLKVSCARSTATHASPNSRRSQPCSQPCWSVYRRSTC